MNWPALGNVKYNPSSVWRKRLVEIGPCPLSHESLSMLARCGSFGASPLASIKLPNSEAMVISRF